MVKEKQTGEYLKNVLWEHGNTLGEVPQDVIIAQMAKEGEKTMEQISDLFNKYEVEENDKHILKNLCFQGLGLVEFLGGLLGHDAKEAKEAKDVKQDSAKLFEAVTITVWIKDQINKYKRELLSKEEIERLESISEMIGKAKKAKGKQ